MPPDQPTTGRCTDDLITNSPVVPAAVATSRAGSDAAAAGLDTQAALNGDVVALISVLDYIVSQISPAGGVFDMLQTLKLGEHLGLSWFDDIIGGLQSSQYFPQLAQALGDFANTIDDLDVLEDVARLDSATSTYRTFSAPVRRMSQVTFCANEETRTERPFRDLIEIPLGHGQPPHLMALF